MWTWSRASLFILLCLYLLSPVDEITSDTASTSIAGPSGGAPVPDLHILSQSSNGVVYPALSVEAQTSEPHYSLTQPITCLIHASMPCELSSVLTCC